MLDKITYYECDVVLLSPDVHDSDKDIYSEAKARELFEGWLDNFKDCYDFGHDFVLLDGIKLLGVKFTEEDISVTDVHDRDLLLTKGTIIGTLSIPSYLGQLIKTGYITGTSLSAFSNDDFETVKEKVENAESLAVKGLDIDLDINMSINKSRTLADFNDDYFICTFSFVHSPANGNCRFLSLTRKVYIPKLLKQSLKYGVSSLSKVSKEQYIDMSPLTETILKGEISDNSVIDKGGVKMTKEEFIEFLKSEEYKNILKDGVIEVLNSDESKDLILGLVPTKEDEVINPDEEEEDINLDEDDRIIKSRSASSTDLQGGVNSVRRKFGWE